MSYYMNMSAVLIDFSLTGVRQSAQRSKVDQKKTIGPGFFNTRFDRLGLASKPLKI